MRENNFADMTVVEQLVRIREDVCEYACKYRELGITSKCRECPLGKIHYNGGKNG